MNMAKLVKLASTAVLSGSLLMAASANAAEFAKSGAVDRTMTDVSNFGGCMVHINRGISNGCPAGGWVSLDCNGAKISPELGKRNYATALLAGAIGKNILLVIDNAKKTPSGHCIATRVDLLF
jgi:hypothetical protein